MTAEPLVTKYRPRTLADVVGQPHVVPRLQEYVEQYHKGNPSMPNLLFAGPAGTGKTSAAEALCRDLYGEGWRQYVLAMNASDERGIQVVRGRVKDFAKASTLGEHFNIILLDECDNLTADAQAALRVTMEAYSKTCRFILCCNYPNKLINPVVDRCAVYAFRPIDPGAALDALGRIVAAEGIPTTPGALEQLLRASRGSLRAALTKLQALPRPLRAEDIPLGGEGAKVLSLLAAKNLRGAEEALLTWLRGGAGTEVVFLDLFDSIEQSALPLDAKNKFLLRLGEYEARIAQGCGLEVQVRCFLRELFITMQR